MTPSSMRSLKMSFIIVWNIAGLLVRPKHMTRGLNKPLFIQKAAFHFFDLYVVVTPADVQLGKILSLGLRYFIEDIWDQGEGVGILNSHCIELLVVLD